jgi:hypothetical protein
VAQDDCRAVRAHRTGRGCLRRKPRALEQPAPYNTGADRVGVSMERSGDVFGGSVIECGRWPADQAFLPRMDRRKQPARQGSRAEPPVPFLDRLRIS